MGLRFPGFRKLLGLTQRAIAPKAAPAPPPPPAPKATGYSMADTFQRASSDGGSASVNLKLPKGARLTTSASLSSTGDVTSQGGYTTATTTGEVSLSVQGAVNTGVVGLRVGLTRSEQTTAQVRVTDEDWARVQRGELAMPNLYDPTTIPVGGSVMMENTGETGTRIDASYRKILRTSSSVTQTSGTSTKVDRLSDTNVRVTVGPTEAIDNEFNVTLGLGPVSVGVGAQKSSSDSHLRTAEFDLSTPEGKAAYDQFLLDGTLPADNGPGVSNVADVQIFRGVQALTASGSVGPLSGETTVASNDATVTITSTPDGQRRVVTDATYGGTSLRVEQTFQGETEDRTQFRATLTFTGQTEAQAMMIYTALTGDPEAARQLARSSDGTVTLTLDAEQAQQIQDRARTIAVPPYAEGQVSGNPMLVDAIGYAASPYHVVVGLAGGGIVLDNGGVVTPGNFDLGGTLIRLARGDSQGVPPALISDSETSIVP